MSSNLLPTSEEEWQAKARLAKFCVERLARLCGVSQRSLERTLKRKWTRCPREWLHDLRMADAQALLLEGCSVKETADAVGYRDPSHFSKVYRRHYAMLPACSKRKPV
jgi:AraC-like DNA-binding protein